MSTKYIDVPTRQMRALPLSRDTSATIRISPIRRRAVEAGLKRALESAKQRATSPVAPNPVGEAMKALFMATTAYFIARRLPMTDEVRNALATVASAMHEAASDWHASVLLAAVNAVGETQAIEDGAVIAAIWLANAALQSGE